MLCVMAKSAQEAWQHVRLGANTILAGNLDFPPYFCGFKNLTKLWYFDAQIKLCTNWSIPKTHFANHIYTFRIYTNLCLLCGFSPKTQITNTISLNSIFIIRQSLLVFLIFLPIARPPSALPLSESCQITHLISQWREHPQVKKKLCKCVNAICGDCRRGSLVYQDLCNLHIICVNLHKFSPPKHKKLYWCKYGMRKVFSVCSTGAYRKTQIINHNHIFVSRFSGKFVKSCTNI